MAKLILKQGEQTKEYSLSKQSFSIGRLPDNDIELKDSLVSRKHTEVVRRGHQYTMYDLGSSNGTYVNKKRIDVRTLSNGDEILIGDTVLVFRDEIPHGPQSAAVGGPATAPPESAPVASEPSWIDGAELVKGLEEIPELYRPDSVLTQSLGQRLRAASMTSSAAAAETLDPAELAARSLSVSGKSRTEELTTGPVQVDRLLFLYSLGREIGLASSLENALARALELTFEAINAERGIILLVDPASGQVLPQVALHRQRGRLPDGELRVSRTIIEKVVREKQLIVTTDARHDERFQQGLSVIQYSIRSAMCVPLWEKRDVFGAVYLDNLLKTYAFTMDDMFLLASIANQIAIRLKQEELYTKWLREQVLRNNLARFHSPDFVEMMVQKVSTNESSLLMEPSEKEVTVLFADIQSSTELFEQMKPSDIAQVLNQFFDKTSRIVFEYQGSVNKFMGDAIMAIFGAPQEHPDHAVRACRAGLKMLKAVRELQASHSAPRPYQVRIGINTGLVIVGNVGSENRLEYTVLGDPVNVAARLEKTAEASTIRIGERTHELVKDHFQTRPLGAQVLRGKQREMNLFQLLEEN